MKLKQHMTKREFQRQLAQIKAENVQKERALLLKAEKSKYETHHPETSKLIAIYLFVLLNAIVIYAMVAMWRFADFSYLGVLISDIAAQVLIYAIYCLKAYHAKKQSEQMKFDRERMNGTLENVLACGAESGECVPLTNGSIDIQQDGSGDYTG